MPDIVRLEKIKRKKVNIDSALIGMTRHFRMISVRFRETNKGTWRKIIGRSIV